MNDTQFSTVLTNHWIMHNPMLRLPIEAYFREQYAKQLKQRGQSNAAIFVNLEDGEEDIVYGVDSAWVSFQIYTASVFPKMLSLDNLKDLANRYIEKELEYLDYVTAENEAMKQRVVMHEEELTKEKALLERCYRKHIFIYCVFMMAVMSIFQFSWVSAIALSVAGGVFSETEGYMNFLKRLCKKKNEENAHKK